VEAAFVARAAAGGGAGAVGGGFRGAADFLGALVDLAAKLGELGLALAGQLLDLHQLPLDLHQAVRQVAAHPHVLGADGVEEGLGAAGQALDGGVGGLLGALHLQPQLLHVLLGGDAPRREGDRHERGDQPGAAHRRSSAGTVVISPPAMANSARRLRAQLSSPSPSTSGRSLP
jgi:hypothetical protein